MSSQQYIVGLDIGSSLIKVVIGEIANNQFQIIGVGSAESKGISKGTIVDIDQTVESIRIAVEQAERMVGIEIKQVFVGIMGNHIQLQNSHGVVAVQGSDKEIHDDDIERVIQAAKVIALPPEREIISVVPKKFMVDGMGEIQDPRSMIGVRLELDAIIFTGAKTTIHNILRCVQRANLEVAGLILSPLAAGEVVLSKDEKNLGVVLVDIGGGSTNLAVFNQGQLITTSVIPIGGDYITNDIAIGLKTNTDFAEKIKLKYSFALIEEARTDEKFKVQRIGSNIEKEFNQVDLANIIEPRVREIFQLILKELYRIGVTDDLPGGFVITGGVSQMPGLLQVAQQELGTSVRIAGPEYVGVRDPQYTVGVGIVKFAAKNFGKRKSTTILKSNNRKDNNSFLDKFKKWFQEFI